MKNIYEILEFDKIRNDLKSFATTDKGINMCENLSTIGNSKELKTAIFETDAAVFYLKNNVNINIPKIYDISNSIMRLYKDAPLNTSEILNISKILDTSDKLLYYQNAKNENSALLKYFQKLISIKNLNDEIKKIIISDDEISDTASVTLLALRRKKTILEEKLKTISNRLINKYNDYLQEPLITIKNNFMCLPIKAEYKSKIVGNVIQISQSQSTFFIEPIEIASINNELTENAALEKCEIDKILAELSKSIKPEMENIKNNYDIITTLDFIFAKAKYARDTNATMPLLNEDGIIVLHSARHPLIDKSKMVPLDIKLGSDNKILIITGPNTGGKTVCLKTVGIIELMAMCGLFIPCSDNSKVAIFDNIFADIGDEQSIEQSLSTFSSHMTNIVYILNNSTKNSLILFDELCTGTDPIEGATLAISILDELLKNDTCVIATTHYPELKKYALTNKNVINGAFEFDIETLKPTYKLLLGIPGKSNAFAISEKLGLKSKIIENAKSLLKNEDVKFEDVIATLETDKRTIEIEKEKIKKEKIEIEELKNKIKRQEKGLNDRADSIIRKAKEEAKDILFDAKNLADTTIKNIKKSGVDTNSLSSQKSNINKKISDIDESMIGKMKGPMHPLSPKKIKVGAKVFVIPLNAEGIVETLPDSDYNLFVQIGIMKTKVNLKQLELIDEGNIKVDGINIKKTKKNGASKIKIEKSYTVSPEINLIGKTSDEAIFLLDKYIDDAYIAHLPYVRIIHGRGAGILKKAVQEYCRKSRTIKNYRLGDFGEGGDGVTIASFDENKT